MIEHGHGVCDVCGDNIPTAAQYDGMVIPAEQITTTQQADGSLRIDVRLDCRTLGRTSAIH